MSPRRNRRAPHADGARRPATRDVETVQESADGSWRVRHVSGAGAVKAYRCPGCDQEIRPGVAHVVAWPADGPVDERRHWHTGCWQARDRRRPQRRRHR